MNLLNLTISTVVLALTIGTGRLALAADQPSPEVELTKRPPPEAEISDKAWPDTELSRIETAQMKAEEYRNRAAQLRRMGAIGYKTGLIRDAEWKAARWDREARVAKAQRAEEQAQTAAPNPEAERYLRMAADFRRMGGVAYKTGLVDWAESQARKHGAVTWAIAVEPRASAAGTIDRPWGWGKPVEVWLNKVREASLRPRN